MTANMDHLRIQLTRSLNRLGHKLFIDPVPDDRDDLAAAYNDLAAYVAGMNCIFDDENALFNDVSHKAMVLDPVDIVGK